SPRQFGLKMGDEFNGFGVAVGFVDGEIDNQITPPNTVCGACGPEVITITYDPPQVISKIKLAFLFSKSDVDDVDETAIVRVNGKDDLTFSLRATDDCPPSIGAPAGSCPNNAFWGGVLRSVYSGALKNLSPADGVFA